MGCNYGFLNSCVTTAEKAFDDAIKSKNSKITTQQREREEIIKYIQIAYCNGELDKNEYKELSERIEKCDFSKVPEIRAKIKESEEKSKNAFSRGGVSAIKEILY